MVKPKANGKEIFCCTRGVYVYCNKIFEADFMCVTYIRNIYYKHGIIAIFSMHVVKLLKFRVLV